MLDFEKRLRLVYKISIFTSMKNITLVLFVLSFLNSAPINSQTPVESFPVRGFSIGAPDKDNLNAFIDFIHDGLASRSVNTLILQIDYGYRFKSHPELSDSGALTHAEVTRIVKACEKEHIRLIPMINLLGHQSWAGKVNNLLRVYPQFDETPYVKMPEKYVWPNEDGLYCKSYCPLHPDIHKVLFDVIDEICDVFQSDAFHGGMDEVFYIAHDSCTRCSGSDPAELFAGEVNLIRNHLAEKNRELWIWGDRLIDGKTTGMGMWEASMNNTYRAVDLIAKDVFICDWHYERPDQTAVYFVMKGLRVATCPWREPEVAVKQAQDMVKFREHSTPEMKDRFSGIIQTVWSSPDQFLKEYNSTENKNSAAASFKAVYEYMNSLK
jgi:hypothetical protein